MATATPEIRALTAGAFRTPEKFTEFCRNDGNPLGGIVDGEQNRGVDERDVPDDRPRLRREALATVCGMGEGRSRSGAVAAAQRAFDGDGRPGWQQLSRCRGRIKLRPSALVELCERDRDVLLACEVRDGGKVSELAEGDFRQIRDCAEYFIGVARRIAMGDGPSMQVAKGVRGFTYREPWGVVAGIIPWNYPIVLTSWFMFPALLSGNTILIKPAEDTPLSALYIGRLAQEAGFPVGVINVLPGRGEITGQAIAENPGVRFISFTGSPGVGQAILRSCDRHGTRMKREMGGNERRHRAGRRRPWGRRPDESDATQTNTSGRPAARSIESSSIARSPTNLSMPRPSSSSNSRSAIRRMPARSWEPSSTPPGAAARILQAQPRDRGTQAEANPVRRRGLGRGPGRLLSQAGPVPGRAGTRRQSERGLPHVRDDLPGLLARGGDPAGQQFPSTAWGSERLDEGRRAAASRLAKQFRDGTAQVRLPQLHRLRPALRRPGDLRRSRRRRQL